MPGYRETVINDGAIAFWTFDSDVFLDNGDLSPGYGTPRALADAVGTSWAIFEADNGDSDTLGHYLGTESLNELEQFDQYAAIWAPNGYIPTYVTDPTGLVGFPKTYLYVPYTSVFSFNNVDNYNSFSIEFLINITVGGNPAGYSSWTSPIFVKEDLINISHVEPFSGGTRMTFDHLGVETDEDILELYQTVPRGNGQYTSLYGAVHHIAFTWDVTEDGPSSYIGVATVYFDGQAIQSVTKYYLDTYPTSGVDNIYMMGHPTFDNTKDRHCNPCYIDQIAVYEKALSAADIADHFQKAFTYDTMLQKQQPQNLWRLDDQSTTIYQAFNSLDNSRHGIYYGPITYRTAGPDNISGSYSVTVDLRGQVLLPYWQSYQGDRYIEDFTEPYTFMIWVEPKSLSSRGAIFSAQGNSSPWYGPTLHMNSRNGLFEATYLEFRDRITGDSINTTWTSDEFHCVIFGRNDEDELFMYLDGELIGTVAATAETEPRGIEQWYPGQFTLINDVVGSNQAIGRFAYLTHWRYALQEQQVGFLSTYNSSYTIKGVVTLHGVPHRARLRFYRTSNGELSTEVYSSASDGLFVARFLNNERVDLIVYDPDDFDVRYRAFGPIEPSDSGELIVVV